MIDQEKNNIRVVVKAKNLWYLKFKMMRYKSIRDVEYKNID